MKHLIIFTILLSISPLSFSCKELVGIYKSDSESHWKYTVEIYPRGDLPAGIEVNYSTYWYGAEEDGQGYEQYQTNSNFEGYCVKAENGYLLKYNGEAVMVTFNQEGTQIGISGEFFKGNKIHLSKNN
jgi:hypothetical protein